MMEQRFLKEVQQKGYFRHHKRVLLALSGGLDSMTLFDLLYRHRDVFGIELYLAHVNHHQREESAWEEKELKKLAKDRGVDIAVADFTGVFSEKAARDFRYSFFEQVMVEKGCTALVTAHHIDDQIETIFMKWLRGSRLRYLSGMKERQNFATGELIRPLLSFKKSDFAEIPHFEDVSNVEDTYLRNRIRNDYLPRLKEENPQFGNQLIAMGEEIAYLYKAFEYFSQTIETTNLSIFRKQPYAVQYFLLEHYLKQFPHLELSRAHFNEILWILNTKANYRQYLKNGYEIYKDYMHFEIREIGPQSDGKESSILIEYNNIVEYKGYRFSFGKQLEGEILQELFVSRETPILLRSRQEGDTILLNHHTKKIRRYFIDQKLSLKEREQAILIEQDHTILGIVGMVASDLSQDPNHDIICVKFYIQKVDR